jgi:RNA polymerase sigma-70 factor (ECF subfamily)
MLVSATDLSKKDVRGGLFATTHWSVVLAASRSGASTYPEALEQLCKTYWLPVYAYIRRSGRLPAEAEDLTQEFFARLLAKEWLDGIERAGGRFRSFLLTAVNRFLANEYDRATAARRGGNVVPLQIEEAEHLLEDGITSPTTPDLSYDRQWALTVLDRAMAALRQEAQRNEKLRHFELFSPFLSREPAEGEYATIAAMAELTSAAVGVAVFRLRRRYREVVRTVIADTVGKAEDVDEELHYLIEMLRR